MVTGIKILRAVAVLLLLQACTQPAPENQLRADALTEAYSTSGLVHMAPYTRTIFSTHNF